MTNEQKWRETGKTHIVLEAGTMLRDFAPDLNADAEQVRTQLAAAMQNPAKRIGRTENGMELDIRPLILNMEAGSQRPVRAEHMMITGWEISLRGRLNSMRPDTLAMLLAGAEAETRGNMTMITLGLGEPVTEDICWVGETTEGLMMIVIPEMLSEEGIRLETADRKNGSSVFQLTAMQQEGETEKVRIVMLGEQ